MKLARGMRVSTKLCTDAQSLKKKQQHKNKMDLRFIKIIIIINECVLGNKKLLLPTARQHTGTHICTNLHDNNGQETH